MVAILIRGDKDYETVDIPASTLAWWNYLADCTQEYERIRDAKMALLAQQFVPPDA